MTLLLLPHDHSLLTLHFKLQWQIWLSNIPVVVVGAAAIAAAPACFPASWWDHEGGRERKEREKERRMEKEAVMVMMMMRRWRGMREVESSLDKLNSEQDHKLRLSFAYILTSLFPNLWLTEAYQLLVSLSLTATIQWAKISIRNKPVPGWGWNLPLTDARDSNEPWTNQRTYVVWSKRGGGEEENKKKFVALKLRS